MVFFSRGIRLGEWIAKHIIDLVLTLPRYVCAACANLGVGGETESWKTVFWIAAGLSIGVGLIRIAFPESKQFRERKEKGQKGAAPGVFWQETKSMLKQEWKMCIYCIILMTWFNCEFFSPNPLDTMINRTCKLTSDNRLQPHLPG